MEMGLQNVRSADSILESLNVKRAFKSRVHKKPEGRIRGGVIEEHPIKCFEKQENKNKRAQPI